MSVSSPVIDVFINSVVKAGGIRRGADVCSCTPDYGVEWIGGGSSSGLELGEGYRGVTAGSSGGGRGRVGSHDLKKPFL